MSEERQRNSMQIAREFRRRPDVLAKELFAYQDQHRLSDDQLVQTVGVPVEKLAWLACSEWPLSEEEIAALVVSLEADGSTLMAWLETQKLGSHTPPDEAVSETKETKRSEDRAMSIPTSTFVSMHEDEHSVSDMTRISQ